MKIQKIIEETANVWGVNPVDVLSKTLGGQQIKEARNVCAFLLKGYLPPLKIAKLLGGRSKSYSNASTTKVRTRSQKDHEYYLKVLKVMDRVGIQKW